VVYELFAPPSRSETARVEPVSFRAERAASAGQAGPRALRDRWAVQLGFAGANPDPAIVGDDRAEARLNYFRGDRDSWKTDVPAYTSVRYQQLWPGIDLALRGEGPHLKYEFRGAAGYDPNEI
jgi:hypothetical protein